MHLEGCGNWNTDVSNRIMKTRMFRAIKNTFIIEEIPRKTKRARKTCKEYNNRK